MIVINGEIKSGDEVKFGKIASEHSDAFVVLDSPGGALAPAMDIGRTIKIREYTTVVADTGSCASACALIWVAGTSRVIFDGGKVGFHASYLDVNGTLIETGMGNALVGHYLAQLGLGEKAVIFATAAAPDKILWLNAETENLSGIEYKRLSNQDSQTTARQDSGTPSGSASTSQAKKPNHGICTFLVNDGFGLDLMQPQLTIPPEQPIKLAAKGN